MTPVGVRQLGTQFANCWLGTPAATTRGFGVAEFKQVGGLIAEVLNAIAQSSDGTAPMVEAAIKERVKALTDRLPIYQ